MISRMRSFKAFLNILVNNSLFKRNKGFGMLLCAGFSLKLLNVWFKRAVWRNCRTASVIKTFSSFSTTIWVLRVVPANIKGVRLFELITRFLSILNILRLQMLLSNHFFQFQLIQNVWSVVIRHSRFFYWRLLLVHVSADYIVVIIPKAIFQPKEFNLFLIFVSGAWQCAALISDHSLWYTMIRV